MYIKFDLLQTFTEKLKRLIKLFNKKHNGVLISQLDESAGLGCHPFHMTLYGNVTKAFPSKENMSCFVSRFRRRVNDVTLELTGEIRVTSKGTVLLMVKGDDALDWTLYDMEEHNDKLTNCYVHDQMGHITLGKIFDKSYNGRRFRYNISGYFLGKQFSPSSLGWDM